MSSNTTMRSATDTKSADVFGRKFRPEIRRLFHIRGVDVDYIRNTVYDDSDFAPGGRRMHRQHDDDGDLGVFSALQGESHAQVDDRNQGAAQIQDAEHVRRRVRNLGHRRPPADLPHAQDLDAIRFVAELEGEDLLSGRDPAVPRRWLPGALP